MSEPMNDLVLAALIRMAREGDLNAAHAVENEIEFRGLRDQYTDALGLFTGADALPAGGSHSETFNVKYSEVFKLIHATAEQRARAAIKVFEINVD